MTESDINQDESDELKEEVSFIVHRGEVNKVSEPYYFITKNGNPKKVGDGTYGAVFGVQNNVGERFVVKIFYETLTTPWLNLLKLTEEHLKEIKPKLKESANANEANGDSEINGAINTTIEKLKQLKEHEGERPFGSIGEFAFALRELDLPEQHFQCILDHFQARSTAFEQFTKEMKASTQIRRALGAKGKMMGIVGIKGSTTDFKESDAGKNFQEYFKNMQIDVSNYALIMERYDYTLKDILENPVGKKPRLQENNKQLNQKLSRIRKKLNQKLFKDIQTLKEAISQESELNNEEKAQLIELTHVPNRYHVLQSMDFQERIKTILPFLKQIAEGLQTLHKAGQYHFDLKPANIFVNDKDGTPVVVIGDLGSIQDREVSKPFSGPSMYTIADTRNLLLLGTRHYRSPEQKDYFDICNVKIRHRDDKDIVLEVTDRKFKDTIIEAGDQVVFSKDGNPAVRYTITKIEAQDTGDTICEIILSDYKLEAVAPDDKTQVMLYKKQGARTDLFGLGAIAYDLITGGESPERFYDKVRIYDKKDETVNHILDEYIRLTQSTGPTDPTVRSIFAPFIQNRSNTDPGFVEFILKCMLYHAKETYYNPDGDLDAAKKHEKEGEYHFAVEAALEAIHELAGKYPPDPKNKLLDPEAAYNPLPENTSFADELDRLQEMSSHLDFPERLAQGAVLFDKVFDLVGEEMGKIEENKHDTKAAPAPDREKYFNFAEMVPQNIKMPDNKLQFDSKTYESYGDYKEDIRTDRFYSQINRDVQNPFVPLGFIALRRRLKLQKTDEEFCRYTFLDSSPEGSLVHKDDWIVGKKMLWKVKSVRDSIPNQIILQPVIDESSEPQQDPNLPVPGDTGSKDEEYVYYQNLDPARYYLNMLGIYLYQIFFANLGKTTRDKPEAIDIAQKVINVLGVDKVKVRYHVGKFGDNFEGVVKLITQMYLRLALYGHIEPPSDQKAQDCFKEVREERDQLLKIAASFLLKDRGEWQNPDDLPKIKREDYNAEWLTKHIPEDKIATFDFNEIILNFVRKNNILREKLF